MAYEYCSRMCSYVRVCVRVCLVCVACCCVLAQLLHTQMVKAPPQPPLLLLVLLELELELLLSSGTPPGVPG